MPETWSDASALLVGSASHTADVGLGARRRSRWSLGRHGSMKFQELHQRVDSLRRWSSTVDTSRMTTTIRVNLDRHPPSRSVRLQRAFRSFANSKVGRLRVHHLMRAGDHARSDEVSSSNRVAL